jgi:hypothetical protein
MQEGALVRVVIVGRVDQHAVGQGNDCGVAFAAADHAGLRRSTKLQNDLPDDVCLTFVFSVGCQRATHCIRQHALGLLHHRRRQVFVFEISNKICQCCYHVLRRYLDRVGAMFSESAGWLFACR